MKKIMVFVLLTSIIGVLIGCSDTTTLSSNSTTTDVQTTEDQETTEVTTEMVTTIATTETTTTETTTTQTTTTETVIEPVDLSVSLTKPYIFVDVAEPKLLSDYVYQTIDGQITLADVAISNATSHITFDEDSFTVSQEGSHSFDITYGDTEFTIFVFSKLAEETDFLVYSISFTDMPDGDLPDGYTIETMDLGSTGIKDGYLFLDSPDIADPTRVLLPDFLKGFKNYIIESDFTILAAVNESRWGSIMYRFSPANYFQMCIRQEATATNGVEFAKAVNGKWNVPVTVPYSENINRDSIYHLKVDLFGATAKEYINDELLIEYKNARDYSNGHIGLQSSGTRSIFNNIEIRIPESYIDYTTIEYQTVPTIYTPDSNIIMAPTVVQTIENQADIDQLAEEVRGSTALFDINPALDAINDSNETILSFIDILEAVKGKTIPAFRTNLPFVAHNLAVKLEEYGVKDVVLISSNSSVIERARADYNLIRGVLEINYDSDKPVLTDADLLEIRNQTNVSGAIAVSLPIEYTTRYNVSFLQKRLITVWADTSELEDYDIIQGIVSGVSGLISEDALHVYDIFDTFPESSMMRLPIIIGHRGMPSAAPENTIQGAELALAAGAKIVELDIYLTTDNHIVVMHDRTTERTTNGNIVVEDSTLAELRELTVTDNFGTFGVIEIPTLEDYFVRFKGEDLQLFIEIKSTNANIVPVLAELIEEHDFYDQALVITFQSAQAAITRELIPEISVGLLNSGLVNETNLSSSIVATINQIVPLRTTLNPNYAAVTIEFLEEMQHRGITVMPWTTNNQEHFLEELVSGVGGISTDFSTWISDEYVIFSVPETEFVYSISNPTTIEIMSRFGTPGGFDYPFPSDLEIISGADTGIAFGSKNAITGVTSTGDVYIIPSFTTTISNGLTVTLYYDVIHVEIIE